MLHLALRHVCRWTSVLRFELVGSEIALVLLLLAQVFRLFHGSSKLGSAFFTYARIDADLTACDVNTSEPDGAGVSRESGHEEGAESHS